jgi:hypothetical protein
MSKLDATARTHAVVVATQRGLIGPSQRASAPKSLMPRPQTNGFHNAALQ